MCNRINPISFFMKQLYTLSFILLVFVCNAKAQFSGRYAPARWTTFLSPVSNGSIDFSGAPNSVRIIGSDGANATNVLTEITINTIAAGIWQFNWAYQTYDTYNEAQWDLAYVTINGTYTQLSNNAGAVTQSGVFSGMNIPANSTITFGINATDNTYGSAELVISNFVPPGGITTLPVSFTQVSATPKENFIRIDWSTASEVNNDYFEIERLNTDNSYTAIGKVKAGTHGNSTQQYSFNDNTPFNGTNYYRIKQVDIDGKHSYSTVAQAKWNNNTQSGIKVIANPVNNVLQVQLPANNNKPQSLQLYNMTGGLLNTWIISTNQLQAYNVSHLAAGIYLLKTADGKLTKKIIKK